MRASGSIQLQTLPVRDDFLKAARARKVVTPGIVLQMRVRDEDPDQPARVGYTASRKVGGAVVRNRARRRMRAVVNDVLANRAQPGRDYVLIARATTAARPYDALLQDLATALDRIETARPRTGAR
jgi:ribonuclease P protein component